MANSWVIVLGIPRSGTSLVTSILQSLGAHVGDELLQPMAGVNPEGFYEDVKFLELHDEIVGSHDNPSIAFDLKQPVSKETLDKYRQLIAAREQHPTAVQCVKDPKMVFCLRHFVKYATLPIKIVQIHRAFDESVKSFMPLHGGMSVDKAAAILGRYLYAFSHTCKTMWSTKSMALEYRHLIENPQPYIQSIAEFTSLNSSASAVSQAARIVKPELRHCH